MLIGTKYKIESDSVSVMLYVKSKNNKTGEDAWKPVAYFSSVKFALRHLVKLELFETDLKDFEAVCKKQDEILALVDGLRV